jgi:hypothetical protein
MGVSPDMKLKAERRLRQLLSEGDFAQPDEVEYGTSSVTLIWHSVDKSIVVDVNEHGEVGKSRTGPPPSASRSTPQPSNGATPRPPTLRQKKAAEQDARAMLDDHGVRQPDEVEYGHGCVRLLWHDERVAMVIDVTEPPSERTLSDLEPRNDLARTEFRESRPG